MFKSVIFSRKMLVIFLLGFSSGIPLALTGATLQAWMAVENIDLATIGLFALAGIPYTWKFLWSPLMDRYRLPFLTRRRGWILLSQVLTALAIAAMAFSDPKEHIMMMGALAVLVAFFSSSQDIVVDAYRTDVASTDDVGPGASLYIFGYRMAMLVSGAAAFIMSDHMPWSQVYLIMACTMGVGVFATLIAPEPEIQPDAPKTLAAAVIQPLGEFFKRKGVVEVILFIVLYKLDVVIAQALMTPFMLQLGFTATDIGTVTKGFGLAATIVGALAGGTLMIKFGMKRSLWVFGLLQGVSGFCFYMLAHLGHHYPMMVTAIAVENFCAGLATAAFSAFLMSLCDKRYTATQYALFSSLFAQSRTYLAAPMGFLANAIGWQSYFLVSIVAMVPGLILLMRFDRWMNRDPREAILGGTNSPDTAEARA